MQTMTHGEFSMKRHGNKRDLIEKGVVEALRKAGATVYLTDKPFDSVVGFRGVTHLVEFKDPKIQGWKSEYTKDQLKFMEGWRGSPVITLRSMEDAVEFLNGQPSKT